MAGRRAVVFGGAGFIGCHLLQRLVAEGHYDNLYSVDIAEPRFSDPRIAYIKSDVREPIHPGLCGDGPLDVFNFAAVLKNDINRARIRKLYQSTNMIPKRLEEAGFRYGYDLVAGLSAWKKSSRRTDFD
jgi:nucleoside-diphosphate-sugar epimerase